jgi:hypothetical protein
MSKRDAERVCDVFVLDPHVAMSHARTHAHTHTHEIRSCGESGQEFDVGMSTMHRLMSVERLRGWGIGAEG